MYAKALPKMILLNGIPTGFLFLKGERAKIIHVIVYIV